MKARRRKIGGAPRPPSGPHRPLPLVPPSSLAPNEPYLNLFSLPSHTPGSSKREVINHRAINNQYFSSNVYRVRFKCLVKTNLRPYDGGLRPFRRAPSPPRPAHPCPSGEYISRPGTDVNSLPDPLAKPRLRMAKEGRRLRNASGCHTWKRYFMHVCV